MVALEVLKIGVTSLFSQEDIKQQGVCKGVRRDATSQFGNQYSQ